MKKIGIITIVKVNNYGAELQAFALQKKLELMGYHAEVIDYLYYKNWRFKDTKESQPFIPMSRKEKLTYWIKYRFINFLIDRILPILNSAVRNRNNRFESFHKINTKFSKTFFSYQELYHAKLDYDIFMVGSDQVWNPAASSTIEPYFLTFAPKDAKKISYASSFGVSQIEDQLKEKYKTLLNNINTISVREDSGIKLVKQLTGKDATQVADPTLLLSKQEWTNYMKLYPNMPPRYILIYQLSDSDAIVNLACRISSERNIPIFRICKRAFNVRKDRGINNILDAGPSEFLSLFYNAEYIITNSFHGTAFSVNFNKSFFTVVSSTKKNNARMQSLLELMNLKDRLIYDNINIKTIDISTQKLDFQNCNIKLEKIQKDSITFLANSLS